MSAKDRESDIKGLESYLAAHPVLRTVAAAREFIETVLSAATSVKETYSADYNSWQDAEDAFNGWDVEDITGDRDEQHLVQLADDADYRGVDEVTALGSINYADLLDLLARYREHVVTRWEAALEECR